MSQKVCYLCGGRPTEAKTAPPTVENKKQQWAALFLPPTVHPRTNSNIQTG